MKKAKIRNGTLEFSGGGISVEGALQHARKYREESVAGGPDNAAQALDIMLHLVEALMAQTHLVRVARTVHSALQEDEALLAAVDAAYRLGGARAVRDLLLGHRAQGG